MRAEALAHINQIKAALALLRRFLDWDVALKRLEPHRLLGLLPVQVDPGRTLAFWLGVAG